MEISKKNQNKGLFEVAKRLMILGGTWRIKSKDDEFINSVVYKIYSVLIQAFFMSLVLSAGVELFQVGRDNIDAEIDVLSKLIFGILLVIKSALCQSKGMLVFVSDILEVEESIFKGQDESPKEIYSKTVDYCIKITSFLSGLSYFLGVFLCSMGIIESNNYSRMHQFINGTLERPFPMPWWLPFDRQKHYNVAMLYQILGIMLAATFSASVNAFNNTVIIFVVSQCEILQYYLKNFHMYPTKNVDSQDSLEETLKLFVNKHQKLIEWNDNLNDSLKYPILIEYVMCSLLLAAVIIQIVQGHQVLFHSIYLSLILTQFMILSWNADLIQVESFEIANSLFKSKWYEQNSRVKVMILFIIARAQIPLKLMIGPFGHLTVEAAQSRIKLAYSYVSLMMNRRN